MTYQIYVQQNKFCAFSFIIRANIPIIKYICENIISIFTLIFFNILTLKREISISFFNRINVEHNEYSSGSDGNENLAWLTDSK